MLYNYESKLFFYTMLVKIDSIIKTQFLQLQILYTAKECIISTL